MSRVRDMASALPTLARVCLHAASERLRPVVSDDPSTVPTAPAQVSTAWLTAALCEKVAGAQVVGVDAQDVSSGTTFRLRLRVTYNERGREAGLPESVFVKASPRLLQRITQAVTGPVEGLFYTRLRPALDIEAPQCFHGAVDLRRVTAITLLEDLVETKRATFLEPTVPVTKAMAEDVVTTLAALHATFSGVPRPPYLKTYQRQWQDAFALVNVERYFLRCFDEADGLIAAPVAADPRRAWRAVLASIALHERLPQTVIHNDVHLGNWYRTADGRLGLCDWQAVVSGHWSRDLAYALATMLAIDDRRAWERELVGAYTDALAAAGGPRCSADDAWTTYRQQLWGALAFWAPTYSPPRLMPSDMQPREISGEMLRRISTACADLDALGAVAR